MARVMAHYLHRPKMLMVGLNSGANSTGGTDVIDIIALAAGKSNAVGGNITVVC